MEFALLDQRMLIFFGILFTALVASVIVAAFFISRMKEEGKVERSLNMVLFLVSLPKFSSQKESGRGEAKEEKSVIAISEQFFAGLSEITESGFLRGFVYGRPYIAFEIAVPAAENEISFYVSVSRKFADTLERQIHSFFPDAFYERVTDYNPFVLGGYSASSYIAQAKHYAMPIRTYQKLEVDPLNAFTNSLSKLGDKDEGAAIQILIAPVKNWQEIGRNVVKKMQEGLEFKKALNKVHGGAVELFKELFSKEKKEPKPLTPIQEEEIKAISEKSQKVGFAVNINLISSAPTKARAEEILSQLENGFHQFSSPNLNSFKINRLSGKAAERAILNFSFRLFHMTSKMILNTEELASVFHFPTPYLETPKIRYLTFKKAPPPSYLPSEGVTLGINNYRGFEANVKITKDDRRRHLYVIGQTGTGKTFLLKNLIRQDMENGEGCCFVDPHGSDIEDVLGFVPKHRADDVVYFDPADLERPIGLNFLEIDPTRPEQKTFVVNEFLTILKNIYGDVPEAFGPMFEQYFKNALFLLLDDYDHEIPTLADIPRIFQDEKFRHDKLSREKNPIVKNFWELEAEKAGGEASLANIAPYINSKLVPFLANDYLRPIIGQKKSAINFREIMDGKKILLVNLSKGRIGDINSSLLGSIIVSKLTQAALARVDTPEAQRPDFYLYIDEFQNYTTPSVSTILSEARKYRLCLGIAHQFIGQLPDNIKSAVFGNVGSMAIFRVGAEDAEFLTQFLKPIFSEYDLVNLDNRNALVRLLINGSVTQPFNLTTSIKGLPMAVPEIAKAIKELSRLKYGRERAIIEEEIQEHYQ